MFARPRSICSRAISRRMTVTPQELSHCAMPDPITPAPITAACTTLLLGVEGPFLYFCQEEIADQVLRRFHFSKIDNCVQLRPQGFIKRNRKSLVDDLPSTLWRGISV